MAKCNGCGKFLSSADSIRCSKCPAVYHRACVTSTETNNIKGGSTWVCPVCKVKTPDALSAVQASTKSVNRVNTPETDIDESMLDLVRELRLVRSELSGLVGEVRECRREIADLKSTLVSYGERLDSMEDRISCLEGQASGSTGVDVQRLENTISELKIQLNERDQDHLSNDIVVTGVPENREESLTHIIKTIANKLGMELVDTDLVVVERVGMPRRNRTSQGAAEEATPRPRNIAVRVSRRVTRDQLVRAARVRRHLTTTDLGLAGPPRQLYLNERLTRANFQMFLRTREEARRLHWRYVWTKDGKIFARREDGKQAERIRSEKDIAKVFGLSTV